MRWSLFNNKKPAVKYFFYSYVKSIGAWVLGKFRVEGKFIEGRNLKGFDSSGYVKTLKQIVE